MTNPSIKLEISLKKDPELWSLNRRFNSYISNPMILRGKRKEKLQMYVQAIQQTNKTIIIFYIKNLIIKHSTGI